MIFQTVGKLIKFSAETKCSGVDLADGTRIRKGAAEAIRKIAQNAGYEIPQDLENRITEISKNGGTPLVVSVNEKPAGVIELQDVIKPGIQERFERLRKMGVKTVMVTGDNPLTAKYIAEKAGVDDFIAEAKPEDKMNYIKKEQRAGIIAKYFATSLAMENVVRVPRVINNCFPISTISINFVGSLSKSTMFPASLAA